MGEMRHGARGNYKHCKAGENGKPCEACLTAERERQREWRTKRRVKAVYTARPETR